MKVVTRLGYYHSWDEVFNFIRRLFKDEKIHRILIIDKDRFNVLRKKKGNFGGINPISEITKKLEHPEEFKYNSDQMITSLQPRSRFALSANVSFRHQPR